MYYKNIIAFCLIFLMSTSLAFAQQDIFETAAGTENQNETAATDNETNSKNQLEIINQIQKSIKVRKNTGEENNIQSNTNVNADSDTDAESETATVQGSVEKTRNMTLDECIRLALLNNPTILAAKGRKEIAKTQIGQAWAAYFPTFSLGVDYSRNRLLPTTKQANNVEYNMFHLPSIEASMLIYDFGKTRSMAKIAKKSFEASDDNLQSSINNIIYDVKEAYYRLLFAFQQEQVYEDTVASYEAHLEQAQNFYDIGTKPKIDVITAQYNLGNAKLDLIKAKHNIEIAYAKLNNAMGIPEHANYNIDENIELPIYELDFDNLLEKAEQTRPELLAAQKKADASKILVSASKAAFFPDLRMFGGWANGGLSPSDNYSFQFGGGLQYKTTNLYLLKKKVDEAKATLKKDNAELDEAKHDVYLDVKAALINFNNAKESIPVAKLALLNAKEQHSLASGRYQTGLSDVIELKDAEVTYLNARLAYYNTLLNYNIAFSNLEKVVGTALGDDNNSEIIKSVKEL